MTTIARGFGEQVGQAERIAAAGRDLFDADGRIEQAVQRLELILDPAKAGTPERRLAGRIDDGITRAASELARAAAAALYRRSQELARLADGMPANGPSGSRDPREETAENDHS